MLYRCPTECIVLLLPRFITVSHVTKTIEQTCEVFWLVICSIQPVGLCIMVTPKLLYDKVLAVRSYIVAMTYCHTVTLAHPGPPSSLVVYLVYMAAWYI